MRQHMGIYVDHQFICYWEVSTDSDTCYNKELWDKHRIQNNTKTYQNIVWLSATNFLQRWLSWLFFFCDPNYEFSPRLVPNLEESLQPPMPLWELCLKCQYIIVIQKLRLHLNLFWVGQNPDFSVSVEIPNSGCQTGFHLWTFNPTLFSTKL